MLRPLGPPRALALALHSPGLIVRAKGQYEPAWRHLQEALQLASQNQLVPVTLNVLVSVTELQLQIKSTSASLREKEAALELLALALNHPASEQTTKERATRLLDKIEPELAPPMIAAAWEQAKVKGFEAVVAETLRQFQRSQF